MDTKSTPNAPLDAALKVALDFITREYEAYEGGQDIRAAAAAVRELHAAAVLFAREPSAWGVVYCGKLQAACVRRDKAEFMEGDEPRDGRDAEHAYLIPLYTANGIEK